MPHKKRKGKTWKKIGVDNELHIGETLNVRCCCQPQKILGQIKITKDNIYELLLKWFGNTEVAIYSDDKPMNHWKGYNGFVSAV